MTSGSAWQEPLAIAEHSYFWLGVERMTRDDGNTITTGEQMYVEYFVPVDVRHADPIVLVHGGGGQGIAFYGPGNGHPGWAHYLLQEGFIVYVVDRPGHGRSPYNPATLGPYTGPAPYEAVVRMFKVGAESGRWPGSGEIGDPGIDQFMAQQGLVIADAARAHALWQARGAELLERIGPAFVLTHSAGGPFGWVVGDACPDLVKGIVCAEGLGPMLTAIPLTYDPPIASLSELSLDELPPADVDWGLLPKPPLVLQTEPARRLANLQRVPIAFVTSEDPRFTVMNGASIAYLRQAGCSVDDLRLTDLGIHGNGHFMPLETNNREVLQVILDWIETVVPAGAGSRRS
jgi:pimeloyl-ACP methyl ester carboxylesterase